MCIYRIEHNRAIRPCHPSHSMPPALVLPRVINNTCVCVFIQLHITAQSGPVILAIICHSHLCVCAFCIFLAGLSERPAFHDVLLATVAHRTNSAPKMSPGTSYTITHTQTRYVPQTTRNWVDKDSQPRQREQRERIFSPPTAVTIYGLHTAEAVFKEKSEPVLLVGKIRNTRTFAQTSLCCKLIGFHGVFKYKDINCVLGTDGTLLGSLKKNMKASKPINSEQTPNQGEKLYKRLGVNRNIGCKDKNSSWHLIGFPDGSNPP